MFSVFVDAVIERDMSMTGASMYWLDALHGCNLDRPLALPYDRYRLVDEQRTGRSRSVTFDFGEDLSHAFLAYASANGISPEHLALACYYVFLFKLTNGERDLCVGMSVNTRYRDELQSVVGLFENTIPLRCQMDPNVSFGDLTKYVAEMMERSEPYSYFPLQRLLAQYPNSLNPSFLNTVFQFQSYKDVKKRKEVTNNGAELCLQYNLLELQQAKIMNKPDFNLTIQHAMNLDRLSCIINASLDLFNKSTIAKITQRFRTVLEQLFLSTSYQLDKSLYEVSLLLPDEALLTHSVNNTEVILPSVSCVHHEFVRQTIEHPQKLAVELDDQSLTYCELLHYVQLLAFDLSNTYGMMPGEIICQCVQRSISMVSRQMRQLFLFL